jgi:Polyketide cyclase / dehydrase and lipid transport
MIRTAQIEMRPASSPRLAIILGDARPRRDTMPTVMQMLDIPAAQERVWEIATDWSRYGEWNPTHTGFPEGPPPAEPGGTFKERITIMGMPGEASWTVMEMIAPTRTVWDGRGPMGIRLGTRLELAPVAEGTIVSIQISFEGGPLTGPIGDTVARSAQKGALESLEKLRGLVHGA